MGVGQHRTGHRVPARHPQRLDPRRARPDLAGFLRDLAQHTRCKVLLTSRRDEQHWLAGLPARIELPPMPMRERLQLAAALAARHGQPRPGHRLAAAAALRRGQPADHHRPDRPGAARPPHHHRADSRRSWPGSGPGKPSLEPGEDAALGRDPVPGRLPVLRVHPRLHRRPSAASSPYCTCSATPSTPTPSACMGDPDIAGDNAVPQLAGTDPRDRDRAAGPGRRHRPAVPPRRRVLRHPPRPALVLHHPLHRHLRPARPPRRPVSRPRLHPHPRRPRPLLPPPGRHRRR